MRGYNSIPIILVGRVLPFFSFAGEWGFVVFLVGMEGSGYCLGYC